MKIQLRIPPVVQGLIALMLIWLLHRYLPFYRLQFVHQTASAVILIVAGLGIAVAGIRAFLKLKTTVDPRTPEKATELVVIGIYKYSRNPMYLGVLLVLMGVAVYLGALSAIIGIASFVAFINKFQIEPEEIALQEKFGERYAQYAQKVGRWM